MDSVVLFQLARHRSVQSGLRRLRAAGSVEIPTCDAGARHSACDRARDHSFHSAARVSIAEFRIVLVSRQSSPRQQPVTRAQSDKTDAAAAASVLAAVIARPTSSAALVARRCASSTARLSTRSHVCRAHRVGRPSRHKIMTSTDKRVAGGCGAVTTHRNFQADSACK